MFGRNSIRRDASITRATTQTEIEDFLHRSKRNSAKKFYLAFLFWSTFNETLWLFASETVRWRKSMKFSVFNKFLFYRFDPNSKKHIRRCRSLFQTNKIGRCIYYVHEKYSQTLLSRSSCWAFDRDGPERKTSSFESIRHEKTQRDTKSRVSFYRQRTRRNETKRNETVSDLPFDVTRNALNKALLPPTDRRETTRCGAMICCSKVCCMKEKDLPKRGGIKLSAENDPESERNSFLFIVQISEQNANKESFLKASISPDFVSAFSYSKDFCPIFLAWLPSNCWHSNFFDLSNIAHCSPHNHDEMSVDNLKSNIWRSNQSKKIYVLFFCNLRLHR